MKYSYTHNNQRFSVVVLRDGRVMEIRRGDMTFCATEANRMMADDQGRQRWDSLDAWRATWPDGAVETNSSSSATPRHPIIQRCFRGKPATVSTAISADKINHLQRQISECKRIIARQPNTNTRYWKSLLADCEDKLRNCRRPYSVPQYKHTRTYVSHHGCFLPVYHNSGENIVHIRVYDPQTKRTVIRTPEELGITEKDNFYCRKWEDVFVPIA